MGGRGTTIDDTSLRTCNLINPTCLPCNLLSCKCNEAFLIPPSLLCRLHGASLDGVLCGAGGWQCVSASLHLVVTSPGRGV